MPDITDAARILGDRELSEMRRAMKNKDSLIGQLLMDNTLRITLECIRECAECGWDACEVTFGKDDSPGATMLGLTPNICDVESTVGAAEREKVIEAMRMLGVTVITSEDYHNRLGLCWSPQASALASQAPIDQKWLPPHGNAERRFLESLGN